SVKGFYKWLAQQDNSTENPFEFIELPKQVKSLPKVLTMQEVQQLLTNPSLTMPEQVAVELLYACGLRVSELVNLALSDFSLEAGYVRCMGKGGKERLIPMGEPTIALLREYLVHHRPGSAYEPLLCNPQGKPYTRYDVFRLMKTLGETLGKSVSPHT